MSRNKFKVQASSGRVADGGPAFGLSSQLHEMGLGSTAKTSCLSYVQEPIDFATISEPLVVVSLKNLQKKESVTKTKALEDLLSSIEANPPWITEDSFLSAWTQLYPRLAIDNSVPVRRGAHQCHERFVVAAKKTFAKYMPGTLPSWLAGGLDNDKSVKQAARTGLLQAFEGEQKQHALWVKYAAAIIDYARDALLEQSVITLSDERTTTPDDASSKYSRAAGGSLQLIIALTNHLSDDEISALSTSLDALPSEPRLWRFSADPDTFLRRSSHRLLLVTLHRRPHLLDSLQAIIGTTFIDKGLAADQKGTVLDYSRALLELSSKYSSIWTEPTVQVSKRRKRLLKFLARGSRNSSPEFWAIINRLVPMLPECIIDGDFENSQELLMGIESGVMSAYEGGPIVTAGWACYLQTLYYLITKLSPEQQWLLIQSYWFPMARSQLSARPLEKFRNVDDASFASITGQIYVRLDSTHQSLFLLQLQNELEETETASQDEAVAVAPTFGRRLCTLLLIHESNSPAVSDTAATQSWEQAIGRMILDLVAQVLNLIKKRRSDATILAAEFLPQLVREPLASLIRCDPRLSSLFDGFMRYDLHELMFSGCRTAILTMLRAMVQISGQQNRFFEIWSSAIERLPLSQDKLESYMVAADLIDILDIQAVSDIQPSSELQDLVEEAVADTAVSHALASLALITQAFRHSSKVLNGERVQTILGTLFEQLQEGSQQAIALQKLQAVASISPQSILAYLSTHQSKDLISRLLSPETTECTDPSAVLVLLRDLSQAAAHLSTTGPEFARSLAKAIVGQLCDPSTAPVLDDTRTALLSEIATQHPEDRELLDQLAVSELRWDEATKSSLNCQLTPGLILTDGLHGYFPDVRQSNDFQEFGPKPAGVSVLKRAFEYTEAMASRVPALAEVLLSSDSRISRALVAVEIIHDASLLTPPNDARTTLQGVTDVPVFLSKAVSTHLGSLESTALSAKLRSVFPVGKEDGQEIVYYKARAMASSLRLLTKEGRISSTQAEVLLRTTDIRRDHNTCWGTALLAGCSSVLNGSSSINKLQNELLNDLSGALPAQKQSDIQRLAILLDQTFRITDTEDLSIPISRIMLLFKEILKSYQTAEEAFTVNIQYQLLKLLGHIIKLTMESLDSHWLQVVELLLATWKPLSDSDPCNSVELATKMPVLHASFELYAGLHDLDLNSEVLDDVLKQCQQKVSLALTRLMPIFDNFAAAQSYPVELTICKLSDSLNKLDALRPAQYRIMFPLLLSHSIHISTAAFRLLHSSIPAAQEQLSVDLALGDSAGGFAPELFPLIMETPAAEVVEQHTEGETMHASLLSFTRTWALVFDHYRNASFRLRAGYSEQLQKLEQVPVLLSTLISLLTNPATGRLVQIPIEASEIVEDDTLSKNSTMALLQIYYQALSHVPVLAKAWYMDLKRGTRELVEQITERYISPTLTAKELQDVRKWYEEEQQMTKQEGEEQKLSVKASDNAKEVSLGYEIDDQTMRIMVKLPNAWPLTNVLIEGVQRVGIPEEKWQSWIRNMRGIITFSNGSLVDGITAWKQNVSGTLKGQTECAICYSIVSSDRQLPTKRCATCKNLFHASCLFKWFKSSSSSSCPLCRTAFQYG